MTDETSSSNIPTTALHFLQKAYRQIYCASVLAGQIPPSLEEMESAEQDYAAPQTEAQALLYAMATLRQAIHLFTKSSIGGGA